MDDGRPAGRSPFHNQRIVLGVTGGIAAYKAVQVARDLTQLGASVDVVMTGGALQFVQPLSFEALTGRSVYVHSYEAGDPLTHIRLAREADAVVVAPATANFLAHAAAGMSGDLLSAILLATRAPVVLCPAMNDRMYLHPQTQANLVRVAEIGYRIAGPATGPLAWGEGEGPGRLIEPAEIVAHVGRSLEGNTPLSGRRIIVTAGPTREAIDPVRFISNRSSGRMGYALATAAWRRGADVVLVTGPSALDVPTGVELRRVATADEMKCAVADLLPDADVLIMAAAVADFRPSRPAVSKIKKEAGGALELELEPAPDILQTTRPLRPAGCVVVGFALETDDPLENGRRKLQAKDLDLLVVNDATEPGAGFETETNRVTILDREGNEEVLPLLPKADVADHILDSVVPLLRPQAPVR